MACCAAAAAVGVVGADDVDAAAAGDDGAAAAADDDEVHLGHHLPDDAAFGYDYDCCVGSSTRMWMAAEALIASPCYPLAWVQFSPSPHRAADPSLCVSDEFDLQALYLHVLL